MSLGFFLNYNAFHFSCPSHTIALKWKSAFRYKYTLRVLQLVWSMSRHQPVSPCQALRDRTTTVQVWRPCSEHAGAEKSGVLLSGILEQPNARQTALKCRRAPNRKNNLVNKRRQPVQVQQCKLKQMIIYCHLFSELYYRRNVLYLTCFYKVCCDSICTHAGQHIFPWPCFNWSMNLEYLKKKKNNFNDIIIVKTSKVFFMVVNNVVCADHRVLQFDSSTRINFAWICFSCFAANTEFAVTNVWTAL